MKKKKTSRQRKTLDGGEWDAPPAKSRRLIFIGDKWKVVELYRKLNTERDTARETLKTSGIPRRCSEQEREQILEERERCKAVLKRNIQEECGRKFPDIVQGMAVWKWDRQATKERWDLLTPAQRARLITVPNEWRRKFDLGLRGRQVGGQIPMELQVELDHLISEFTLGKSDVTERREVVTFKDIAPCLD